jgi:hypothetical protein
MLGPCRADPMASIAPLSSHASSHAHRHHPATTKRAGKRKETTAPAIKRAGKRKETRAPATTRKEKRNETSSSDAEGRHQNLYLYNKLVSVYVQNDIINEPYFYRYPYIYKSVHVFLNYTCTYITCTYINDSTDSNGHRTDEMFGSLDLRFRL